MVSRFRSPSLLLLWRRTRSLWELLWLQFQRFSKASRHAVIWTHFQTRRETGPLLTFACLQAVHSEDLALCGSLRHLGLPVAIRSVLPGISASARPYKMRQIRPLRPHGVRHRGSRSEAALRPTKGFIMVVQRRRSTERNSNSGNPDDLKPPFGAYVPPGYMRLGGFSEHAKRAPKRAQRALPCARSAQTKSASEASHSQPLPSAPRCRKGLSQRSFRSLLCYRGNSASQNWHNRAFGSEREHSRLRRRHL